MSLGSILRQLSLLRQDACERMRHLLDEDVVVTGELADRVMAEEANDPDLESYQHSVRRMRSAIERISCGVAR